MLIYSFLVNMHFAFQDRENLFLVIDLMPGGDLRYHFAKHRKFTEEQTSKLNRKKINSISKANVIEIFDDKNVYLSNQNFIT